MSLGTILAGIWNGIKSLFGALSPELKLAVHIGIEVTEGMKMFVDSPVADIVTAIIPGDADDAIKDILRAKLPAILVEMHLVEDGLNSTDVTEVTESITKVLQSVGLGVGDKLELAAKAAIALSNGQLTWEDAVTLTQYYYNKIYKSQGTPTVGA